MGYDPIYNEKYQEEVRDYKKMIRSIPPDNLIHRVKNISHTALFNKSKEEIKLELEVAYLRRTIKLVQKNEIIRQGRKKESNSESNITD